MILQAGKADLTLNAQMEQLPELCRWLEDIFAEISFPSDSGKKVLVCTDEIFNNIVSYAYPDGCGTVSVSVRFDAEQKRLELSFTDRGIPFNPLAQTPPELNVPGIERQMGGLGIWIVRKMTDSVEYRRENECNILTLTKHAAVESER